MLLILKKCSPGFDFQRSSSSSESGPCKDGNMMDGSAVVLIGACNVKHPLHQGNNYQLYFYALDLLPQP